MLLLCHTNNKRHRVVYSAATRSVHIPVATCPGRVRWHNLELEKHEEEGQEQPALVVVVVDSCQPAPAPAPPPAPEKGEMASRHSS